MVVAWDDLDRGEGRKVRATSTIQVALNGVATEVDVSDENRERIEEFLRPFFRFGHKPETVMAGPGKRGYKFKPGVKAARQRMRDWADEQIAADPALAEKYGYLTPSGNYYYPADLKEDFAAFEAAQRRAG